MLVVAFGWLHRHFMHTYRLAKAQVGSTCTSKGKKPLGLNIAKVQASGGQGWRPAHRLYEDHITASLSMQRSSIRYFMHAIARATGTTRRLIGGCNEPNLCDMDQHYVSPCWWDVWIKLLSSLPQYNADRPGDEWILACLACCAISTPVWPFRWCMDMRRWRPICIATTRLPFIMYGLAFLNQVTRHVQWSRLLTDITSVGG
jgi:hypothetical protein